MQTKQWEADANTECSVLLQRIRDAYFEGFQAAGGVSYAEKYARWERSDAKRIHDTLEQLWGLQ